MNNDATAHLRETLALTDEDRASNLASKQAPPEVMDILLTHDRLQLIAAEIAVSSEELKGITDILHNHLARWIGARTTQEDGREPVAVSGVMLRGDGKDIVVAVEVGGRWVEVVREFAANTDTISHIVEPAGIRAAIANGQATTGANDEQ